MKRFGEKLHALRTQQDLSLRQLASQLNMKSHSHLNKIEIGTRKPSADLIVMIVQYFNVSFDQLMDDDVEL